MCVLVFNEMSYVMRIKFKFFESQLITPYNVQSIETLYNLLSVNLQFEELKFKIQIQIP